MISERTKQLVQDIFLQVRAPTVHKEVREDPEAFLLSLLTEINQELNTDRKYRATLYHIVQSASFTDNVEKAKEEIAQPA